ncbi:hypothetical protein EX30DRAFT_225618 [Ascodesmis nigricans]|uniref:Secreted protein n=1 Tax=Ascodesmis nigricans TaxID=341454 RepID=A0A4V6RHA8_9PEZI|nr:hypothetical protein EX30DRAFT_225618 [Ascodesmis nigricans]
MAAASSVILRSCHNVVFRSGLTALLLMSLTPAIQALESHPNLRPIPLSPSVVPSSGSSVSILPIIVNQREYIIPFVHLRRRQPCRTRTGPRLRSTRSCTTLISRVCHAKGTCSDLSVSALLLCDTTSPGPEYMTFFHLMLRVCYCHHSQASLIAASRVESETHLTMRMTRYHVNRRVSLPHGIFFDNGSRDASSPPTHHITRVMRIVLLRQALYLERHE